MTDQPPARRHPLPVQPAGARTTTPVVARPAATVVLARPGPAGLEVLLTQRPSTMAFAADLHVFPGGAIDPGDAAASATRRSRLDPAAAARALGGDAEPDEALAAHVAAVRELWEESGVALVVPSRGATPAPSALAEARQAMLAGQATIGDVAADLQVDLATDQLVALSRWVTPRYLARRFDVRFFLAAMPPDGDATFTADEVVAHRWVTPRTALDAMAAGDIDLWIPTSATLQQLEHATTIDDVRSRVVPGPSTPTRLTEVEPGVVRVTFSGAGGVPGQTVNTWLVGRRELVVVDPGDPSDAAADALVALAEARGGSIRALVLTSAEPDHAGGSEALALGLDVPIHASAATARDLPAEVSVLADGDRVPVGDTELVALATPGPRVDHTALVAPGLGAVLVGDLVGPRAAQSIFGPPDVPEWLASLARVEALAPRQLLPGHGDIAPDVRLALDVQRRRLPPG